MPRTNVVRVLFLTLVCGLGGILEAQTGTAVPSLAPFDDLVTGLLAKYRIPGASLALTQNGRLIYARGYGNSDAHLSQRVQPDSLFRVASLSKAITAVAVMKLVEQGKIKLDTPAFALLRYTRATQTRVLSSAARRTAVAAPWPGFRIPVG